MNLKVQQQLTKIILEAYEKGIYEAEELAAFITKSGIFHKEYMKGYIFHDIIND